MSAPLGWGTFVVLAAALLMAAAPAPRSEYWVGEVEGVSMAPTLQGQRKTFDCAKCGQRLSFDLEKTQRDALLPCSFCDEWQVLPKSAETLLPDRVLIGHVNVSQLKSGDILAISHPRLGRVIKRLIGVPGDYVRITSLGTWVNSRSFGIKPGPVSKLNNRIEKLIDAKLREAKGELTTERYQELIQEVRDGPTPNLTVPIPPRSLQLKSGEFFVLGDDLENSTDSREEAFGLVLASQIDGKVVTILPRLSSEPASQTASISKAK